MAPVWERVAILAVPLVLLGFWAGWLGRRPPAPRFIRAIPGILTVTTALAVATQEYFLRRAEGRFDAEDVDPTTLASQTASDVTTSTHVWLAGAAALVAALFYLLFATWRYHWSWSPPVVPRSPPYR
jgi:hypothetical protein